MQITEHAQARMQQRGIPLLVVQLIQDCGTVSYAPGGAYEVVFGKREAAALVGNLKKIIQAVDKASGTAILIKDNRILTVYRKHTTKNDS